MLRGLARLLLSAKLDVSLVQAKRGEDESYTPLVLGPARQLDTVLEVDEEKAIAQYKFLA